MGRRFPANLRVLSTILLLMILIMASTQYFWKIGVGAEDSLKDSYSSSIIPTEIEILIDASTSMNSPYSGNRGDKTIYSYIRDYVFDFCLTMQPQERITIVLFASNIGSKKIIEYKDIADPSGFREAYDVFFPRTPLDGKGTDIKLAINEGLSDLAKSNRKIRALICLTDGKDQPINPLTPTAGKLSGLFKELPERENLIVYGLPVRNYSVSSTEYEEIENGLFTLLNRVFPPGQIIMLGGNAKEIMGQMENKRKAIRETALRLAILPDSQVGYINLEIGRIIQDSKQGKIDVVFKLRNDYVKLPVIINEVKVLLGESDEVEISVSKGSSHDKKQVIQGNEELEITSELIIEPIKKQLRFTPKQKLVEIPISITIDGEYVDQAELSELFIVEGAPRPRIKEDHFGLKLAYFEGFTIWQALLGILAAITTIIGVIVLRSEKRTRFLFGKVYLDNVPVDFEESCIQKPSIEVKKTGTGLVMGGEGSTVARFYSRRSGSDECMFFCPSEVANFETAEGEPVASEVLLDRSTVGMVVRLRGSRSSIQFDEDCGPRKVVKYRPLLLIVGLLLLIVALYMVFFQGVKITSLH